MSSAQLPEVLGQLVADRINRPLSARGTDCLLRLVQADLRPHVGKHVRNARVRPAPTRSPDVGLTGQRRGRPDDDGDAVVEARTVGAPGRRVSRHLANATAVHARRRKPEQHEEADDHRPGRGEDVLLEGDIKDDGEQDGVGSSAEFRHVMPLRRWQAIERR